MDELMDQYMGLMDGQGYIETDGERAHERETERKSTLMDVFLQQ